MRDGIDPAAEPSGTGCQECLASGGWWLHLRRCAQCGHVGCCDSSPSRHATHHHHETGHPVIRSFEPGEAWFYDYQSGKTFAGPSLAAPEAHPSDQPAPGPRGRVPEDWQAQLNGQVGGPPRPGGAFRRDGPVRLERLDAPALRLEPT